MALIKPNRVFADIDADSMPLPRIGPLDNLSSIVHDFARGVVADAFDCSAYVSDSDGVAEVNIGSDTYEGVGFSFDLAEILGSAAEDLGADTLREIVDRAIAASEESE